MTTWAIGDIQGCADAYFRLLETIGFTPSRDTLWIAGDLVNRGPDNLSVLRHLRSLEASATVVLGNHDLHLLAANAGARKLSRKDTLHDVIAADDCEELLSWLRHQPLLAHNSHYCMSHAGVPAIWPVSKAQSLANEVAKCLQHPSSATEFFFAMYGNTPDCWNDQLEGVGRLRVITNYLTRMRFVSGDGSLDLTTKEGTEAAPEGFAPWFTFPRQPTSTEFLFGHWAALEGHTGTKGFHALDTGCVWGGSLTAMNLNNQERTTIPATKF